MLDEGTVPWGDKMQVSFQINRVPCPASANAPPSSICGQVLDYAGAKAWIGGESGTLVQHTSSLDATDDYQLWVIERFSVARRGLRGNVGGQ